MRKMQEVVDGGPLTVPAWLGEPTYVLQYMHVIIMK